MKAKIFIVMNLNFPVLPQRSQPFRAVMRIKTITLSTPREVVARPKLFLRHVIYRAREIVYYVKYKVNFLLLMLIHVHQMVIFEWRFVLTMN